MIVAQIIGILILLGLLYCCKAKFFRKEQDKKNPKSTRIQLIVLWVVIISLEFFALFIYDSWPKHGLLNNIVLIPVLIIVPVIVFLFSVRNWPRKPQE